MLFGMNILYKNEKQVIDNNTLVAVTILIAESNHINRKVILKTLSQINHNFYGKLSDCCE